jgi:hypothetical protein
LLFCKEGGGVAGVGRTPSSRKGRDEWGTRLISTHDWDTSTAFLRKEGYITVQQEKFARGIYALISDEGVHPLMSERVFARVLRNVTIEYGFMFLTVMHGKGVNLKTP